MKVLVIGGGGREHALAWKLAQSPLVSEVLAAPGNPGIAQLGRCVRPGSATPEEYLRIARETGADLTVVGPEAPLVAGVVDAFRAAGLRIVGATAAAAQLEGSKVFSKQFMLRAGVPTAEAHTAADAAEAQRLLDRARYPVVLKADGLAAGKGVVIASSKVEALEALANLPAGRFVIEEFLQGEEVSFIVYTDGKQVVPLEATQDHKAVWDSDKGPNTGGMGAYCDGRILTPAEAAHIMDLVIHPTLDRMRAEGMPYTGFLYAGLMMTRDGPKVLEFNARLGDPETQPLMHRMESDLLPTLLEGVAPRWKPDPSVCVVLAAHGYPGEVRNGDAIHGLDGAGAATVFQAGTRQRSGGGIETSGGRVLGVTASGPDLRSAIENTYEAVRGIHFDGMHYRRDIGEKGLKRW
jgi:phosphoribosylamine--glycine ligase